MSLRRLRCSRCKREYHPFYGTPFVTMRIPYTSWLLFLKLFEAEVSTRKAGRQTGVSHPTALRVFDTIRRAIVGHLSQHDDLLKGEIKADESYIGGRRRGNGEEYPGIRPSCSYPGTGGEGIGEHRHRFFR
jgi:hypothetical protein